MRIRVLPEAFSDLEEGVDWYDAQREGLGGEFEEQFYSAIEKIAVNPLIARPIYQQFRRKILNRFQYGVFYRLHEDQIVVVLFFHLMRDPKRLRALLRSRDPDTQS